MMSGYVGVWIAVSCDP